MENFGTHFRPALDADITEGLVHDNLIKNNCEGIQPG